MRSAKGWIAAGALALWAAPPGASAYPHPGGAVNEAQVERARQALAAGEQPWTAAWSALLARAAGELDEAVSAVEDLHVPAYYEDAAGHEAAKKALRGDVNAAYRCALVWRIGFGLDAATRERYGAKAREMLDAWARVNRSVSGGDGRLVMAYVGTALVIAAELMRDDPDWSATSRARFSHWTDTVLRDVAQIESRDNNWGSWGVFAGLVGAHWRDDAEGLAQHGKRLRELIDQQIDPDGGLPRELGRGDKALWYTYFSLAPLTHAAEVLRAATGEDLSRWQPPSGGSLAQALEAFRVAALAAIAAGGSPDLTPSPSGWGGDLLFATGHRYGESEWLRFARPPFGSANSAWKSPDLLVPAPDPPRPAAPVLFD